MDAQNKHTHYEIDPKRVNYEIFILALSTFSLINIVLLFLPIEEDMKTVIRIVDNVTSIIYLFDFFHELNRMSNKRAYIIKDWGWLDFIGSLPFTPFRIARLFRIMRIIWRVQESGQHNIRGALIKSGAASSVLGIIFLTIVAIEYSSILVLAFEDGAPNANITNASDALWWSYQTVTTVGYGDRTPVTNPGRVVGVVLMTIGVALFTIFTSFLANIFVSRRQREVATIASRWGNPPGETAPSRRRLLRRRRQLKPNDAPGAPPPNESNN